MPNYGAVARRQRSAPALTPTTESQPLLHSFSSTSSTTTIGDVGDNQLANGNGHTTDATNGHGCFSGLLSHGRRLENPEDRLFKDSDKETWGDAQLGAPDMVASNLVITLSTAMLDAVMYRLYGTFATNQTGNTVFLTLAVLHWGTAKLILAMASLGGFFGAGLIMGQLGARFGTKKIGELPYTPAFVFLGFLSGIGPLFVVRGGSRHRRRWWVVTTMVYQCVILLIFTWVVSPWGHYMVAPGGPHEWFGMLLSAIQGGPQVVMATNLGVPEMPTAMVTSAYAGLISDIKLFSSGFSVPRDRRIVYLITFWVGSFIGLGVEQFTAAWFAALLSAILKLIALRMIVRARPSGASGSARA